MIMPRIKDNLYWLNGNNEIGIRSGATSVAQRFCSGSRRPVINQGSNPSRLPGSRPESTTRGADRSW